MNQRDRGDTFESKDEDDDATSCGRENITEEDAPTEANPKVIPPPVPPRPQTARGQRTAKSYPNETMASDDRGFNRYRTERAQDFQPSHLNQESFRSHTLHQPGPPRTTHDSSPTYHGRYENETTSSRVRYEAGARAGTEGYRAPPAHEVYQSGLPSGRREYGNGAYASRGDYGGNGASTSRREYENDPSYRRREYENWGTSERGAYGNEPSTSRGYEASSSWASSYTEQVSNEEREIGEQTRLFLNMFIQERVENTPAEPIIRDVCQADKQALKRRSGLSDESLSDIALTLRRIGDDMSQNIELNNMIEQVPIDSTRDTFMKVCFKIFQDGNLNWGRVVALFYFAYRLVMRTASRGMEGLPWIRNMLTWAIEFIVKNVAKWIISVGGWKMIKDYMTGVSSLTWGALAFISLAVVLWASFKKD